MAVEIQQIVIRANASDRELSDKNKTKTKDCSDDSKSEMDQNTANMINEILKNEKER